MEVVKEGTCSNCGYDLQGLSIVGQCPECGQKYDGYTRHGFGNHAAHEQAKMDAVVARARTGCFALLAVGALACAGVASFSGYGNAVRAFSVGIVFAVFFGLAALVSYLYEKPEG